MSPWLISVVLVLIGAGLSWVLIRADETVWGVEKEAHRLDKVRSQSREFEDRIDDLRLSIIELDRKVQEGEEL